MLHTMSLHMTTAFAVAGQPGSRRRYDAPTVSTRQAHVPWLPRYHNQAQSDDDFLLTDDETDTQGPRGPGHVHA